MVTAPVPVIPPLKVVLPSEIVRVLLPRVTVLEPLSVVALRPVVMLEILNGAFTESGPLFVNNPERERLPAAGEIPPVPTVNPKVPEEMINVPAAPVPMDSALAAWVVLTVRVVETAGKEGNRTSVVLFGTATKDQLFEG
jgi:hypothetical protein